MSFDEARSWEAYMRKRGSINLGPKMELGFASLMALVMNRTGSRATASDYLPKREEEDDEGDATLDDVMKALMGARR